MFDFKQKKNQSELKGSAMPLSDCLQRTRSGLFGKLIEHLKQPKIDTVLLSDFEDHLISADMNIDMVDQIIKTLTEKHHHPPLVRLKKILHVLLKPVEQTLDIPYTPKPFLVLVVGVNGAGKTTTIGKLSKRLQTEGKSVMLAAGDTFRAAAIEQIQFWGKKNNVRVIAQPNGSDAGAVIYDALGAARANATDILIADTAGRLHNHHNLMEEIKKIYRIADKFDAAMPREILLVLDATMGQNALVQAKQFHNAIGVSGIVLTKLDGTAKGGIIFSLASELAIPIRYIGVGENINDLRPFCVDDFIDALLVNDA